MYGMLSPHREWVQRIVRIKAVHCNAVQYNSCSNTLCGRGLRKGGGGRIIFSLLSFERAINRCAARTRLLGMYSTMGPSASIAGNDGKIVVGEKIREKLFRKKNSTKRTDTVELKTEDLGLLNTVNK
jgi:hypothetical protein